MWARPAAAAPQPRRSAGLTGSAVSSRGTNSTALVIATAATAEPATHGSHPGWMLLPNTSPAARRTTLALTT